MIYIVAYDIANNRRWLKVAKILESWGYRIQESVFQLRLDTDSLAPPQTPKTSSTSTPSAPPAPTAPTYSVRR